MIIITRLLQLLLHNEARHIRQEYMLHLIWWYAAPQYRYSFKGTPIFNSYFYCRLKIMTAQQAELSLCLHPYQTPIDIYLAEVQLSPLH